MTPLYDHQKKIIEQNPKWIGLWLGTGGGKTRTILELADGETLVIVPKQQKLDRTWENNLQKFQIQGVSLHVISKEEFRRDWETLQKYDTVIIDEAHNHFGVTPDTRQVKGKEVPRTSQLFEATAKYIQKTKPDRFYMGTATPASKPMNVWAIAYIFGIKWNFFSFRNRYYVQRKIGFRSIWLPKNTQALKQELADLVKKLGFVGKLQDWFDVPEQTHTVKYFDLTDEQKAQIRYVKSTNPDPMGLRMKQRTIENGCSYELAVQSLNSREDVMRKASIVYKNEKLDYILERAEEFPKMLIFANYIAQVEHIALTLEKAGYTVLTLTGATKDRSTVISKAESLESCIVVAQSGISAGYELKTVPVVIFASKSSKFLDYDQGLGRVLRADALKKNLYIHLVVKGGVDEACHDTIMRGEDFQEKIQNGAQ